MQKYRSLEVFLRHLILFIYLFIPAPFEDSEILFYETNNS